MAGLSWTWKPPLEELGKQWASMPESFTAEADHRAEEAVQGAAVAIKQVYGQHYKTGNLQKRVYASRRLRGKLATIWKVTAGAPHTWLFENGTQQRSYITKPGKTPGSGGKVHRTGAMWKGQPPPATFFPTVNRFRRQFETQLVQMLERQGLVVRQVITGTLRHLAALDMSGVSLDPATWYCAATDDGQGQQTLTGRFHPGISVHTRVHLKGRIYHVDSVRNTDERDRELILRCTEVFDV